MSAFSPEYIVQLLVCGAQASLQPSDRLDAHAHADVYDASVDHARRIYQRHAAAIHALPVPLKALCIVHLASRAIHSGAQTHLVDNNDHAVIHPSNRDPRPGSAAATAATTAAGHGGSAAGVLGAAIHADVSVLANILLSSYSADLSLLKRLIDYRYPLLLDHALRCVDGGQQQDSATLSRGSHSLRSIPPPSDHVDLIAVISLLPPPMRAHVTHHIHVEAAAALSVWAAESAAADGRVGSNLDVGTAPAVPESGSRAEKRRERPCIYPIKIYSDFDDTAQAKLFDRSFPSGTTYPGYLALIRALRGELRGAAVESGPPQHAAEPPIPDVDDASVTRGVAADLAALHGHDLDAGITIAEPAARAEKRDDNAGHGELEHAVSAPGIASPAGAEEAAVLATFAASDAFQPVTDEAIDEASKSDAQDAAQALRQVASVVGSELMPLPSVASSSSTSAATSSSPSVSTSAGSLSAASAPGHSDVQTASTSGAGAAMPPRSRKQSSPSKHSQPAGTLSIRQSILGSLSGRRSRMTVFSDYALGAWAMPDTHTDGTSAAAPHQSVVTLNSSIASTALDSGIGRVVAAGLGSVQRKVKSAISTVASSAAATSAINSPAAVESAADPRHGPSSTYYGNNNQHDQAISTGPVTPFVDCADASADLVFLSARPGFLRLQTLAMATAMGLGHAAILCGTITAALNHRLMAARKLANHMLHHSLFPESRVVFIGDSGQADVEFALQMIAAHGQLSAGRKAREPKSLLSTVPPPVVLIHDICGSDQVPSTGQPQRAKLRAKHVHVFDSYIDAAAVCYRNGLMDAGALLALIDECTDALARVTFGYGNESQRVARLQDYQLAVRRAHYTLAAFAQTAKTDGAASQPHGSRVSSRAASVAGGADVVQPAVAVAEGRGSSAAAALATDVAQPVAPTPPSTSATPSSRSPPAADTSSTLRGDVAVAANRDVPSDLPSRALTTWPRRDSRSDWHAAAAIGPGGLGWS